MILSKGETIYALASGAGRAGVAVIRTSGPKALIVAETIAGPNLKHRQAHFRALRDGGELIDEAIVIVFEAPNSFTGETVVEYQIHGAPSIVSRLLQFFDQNSLRLAEPGEFTRRSVMNNRLDLLRAEAIADLIDSETEAQRKQALRQLRGDVSQGLERWRNELLDILARLEVSIDFPDEDIPIHVLKDCEYRLDSLRNEWERDLISAKSAVSVREGYSIIIMGAPNAGKSSLFNALLRTNRAIVSPHEGTTRDLIEARISLGAYMAILIDTAGLRKTDNEVEAQGIVMAKQWCERADLRLWVSNPETGFSDIPSGTHDWWILNKIDQFSFDHSSISSKSPIFALSAMTGEGIEPLKAALIEHITEALSLGGSASATNARHISEMRAASAALGDAINTIYHQTELSAESVRYALRAFDRLFGRFDVEDVLGRIFSSFCIGK